ncbi:MAG: nucleotide exchange factor GrpE [bacterium]|nr:nucleotide exchange factor GrpE [bacterium]
MTKKPTIAELEQKIGELTEALQRERADAMNVRRRTDEDKAKLGDFYKVMILRELLPALDNLERALQHIPDHKTDISRVAPWKQGVEGVVKQFDQCLEQLGVERIKTVGEHFDPKLHEAVHMEEGGHGIEVVCEELASGYKIGDEVIRHAMVKVKKEKR